MAKKKNLFLLLVAILAIAASIVIWNLRITSLPSPTERIDAEKEIYSLLLVELIADDGIPLADGTTLGFLGYEGITQDDFSEWHDMNHSLKRETFDEFIKLNQQSYSIREYIPKEMSDQIIGRKDWWVSVSRIGFNSELNQALVTTQRNMGCDSKGYCCYDDGSVLFLLKKDNRWVIEAQLSIWIGECTA